jgi:hypothetical protein
MCEPSDSAELVLAFLKQISTPRTLQTSTYPAGQPEDRRSDSLLVPFEDELSGISKRSEFESTNSSQEKNNASS